MANLEDISEAMQFDVANSTTECSQIDGTSLGEKLVPLGRQTVGYRFMIGITPLADDQRYDLQAASLQTSGNSFVAPNNASLRAATDLLKPDEQTGTWPLPYAPMAKSAAEASAYPGTMVVYASVPTSGIPSVAATDYAALLRFAATTGQDQGFGVGQLPPGYLPMTKAEGLGALADYTVAAANDVAAQKGELPSMTPQATSGGQKTPPTTVPLTTVPPTTAPATTVPPTTAPATTLPSTTFPPTTFPPTTVPPTTVARHSVAPTTVPPTTQPPPLPGTGVKQSTRAVALGPTLAIGLGSSDALVVWILAFGILFGLGVPVTYFVGRRRGRW